MVDATALCGAAMQKMGSAEEYFQRLPFDGYAVKFRRQLKSRELASFIGGFSRGGMNSLTLGAASRRMVGRGCGDRWVGEHFALAG